MTRKEFSIGFAVLCANFGKVYDKETLDIFFSLTKDLDPECFLRSVQAICQEHKELYPGTNIVALIRHKVVDLQLKIPSPEQAWEMVVKAFDCQSSNLVDQPIISRAVDSVGGIDSIRHRYRVDIDADPGIVRAQFIKQYSAIANREHTEAVSPMTRLDSKGVLGQIGIVPKQIE